MKILKLTKIIGSISLAFIMALGFAMPAHANVMWANGNLGFNASAGGGNECPLVMVGTATEGTTQSGNELCWASSISPVQAGDTFKLLIKFKNAGSTTATGVHVRLTPGGITSAVNSRTFTAKVSGFDGATLVEQSRSVTVNLASAQTITVGTPEYFPAPYTNSNVQNISFSQLSSAAGYALPSIPAGFYGYVRVPFTVGNAVSNIGPAVEIGGQINNVQPIQAPVIQTVSGTLAANGSASLNGKCISGPITKVWFNIKDIDNNNLLSSTAQQNQTACTTFNQTTILPNIHYQYQACGINAMGLQGCGAWMNLTKVTAQQPNSGIDTLSASSISTSGATLNGKILTGNNFYAVWFRYDTTSSGLTCINGGTQLNVPGGDFDAGQTFSVPVGSLSSNTTYYVRACGVNPESQTNSPTVGDLEQFTTSTNGGGGGGGGGGSGSSYDIRTNSATNIDNDSATLQGEITSGTNFDEAWFTYSSDDTSPECNGNDDTAQVSGSDFDDGDVFSKAANNLTSNTKYYFRACAQRNNSDYEGTVKNFTTKSGSSNTSLTIDTLPVSNVGTTDATARGFYGTNNCSSLKTYFRYGTSAGKMDSSTGISTQNKKSDTVEASLNNLAWGKTYYTQFVGMCGSEAVLGDIVKFTTTGFYVPTPGKTPVAEQPSTDTCAQVKITDDTESVIPNQYVSYRVQWNNACKEKLENTLIKVTLAPEVLFLTTSHGSYAGEKDHSVVMNISTLDIGDEGFAIISAQLKSSAKPGTLAVTQADLGGKNDSDGISSTAFDVDNIMDENGNAFGASAFGSGFFGGPLGWIIALAVLALIMVGARGMFAAGSRAGGTRGTYAPVYSAMQPPMAPSEPRTIEAPAEDMNAYTAYRPKPFDPTKK